MALLGNGIRLGLGFGIRGLGSGSRCRKGCISTSMVSLVNVNEIFYHIITPRRVWDVFAFAMRVRRGAAGLSLAFLSCLFHHRWLWWMMVQKVR